MSTGKVTYIRPLSLGEGTNAAFTLAEVLITLGIIGVVAALTIPALTANYQKMRTESYLKKFYANMNNALRMAAVEYGDPQNWIPERGEYSYNQNLDFLQTYILPYIKYTKYFECNDQNRVCVALTDGTLFSLRIDYNGGDIGYFINGKFFSTSISDVRTRFFFQINKDNTTSNNPSQPTFIEPYIYHWNGTQEDLKNNSEFGCVKGMRKAFCAKLIQLNGWKIPDDYPW